MWLEVMQIQGDHMKNAKKEAKFTVILMRFGQEKM